jgi:hypothetical protein
MIGIQQMVKSVRQEDEQGGKAYVYMNPIFLEIKPQTSTAALYSL